MFRRVLLSVLLLSLAGCVAPRPLYEDVAAAAPPVSMASVGLAPVHSHDDVRIALLVAFGLIIVFLVLVDLFLLPFSYHRHHLYFPCCRWCVHTCL